MKQITFYISIWLCLLAGVMSSCRKTNDEISGPPAIEKFSPLSGGAGQEILIYGNNFGTDTSKITVTLNGRKAVVTGVVNNRILFLVPTSAGSGKVAVTVAGQSVSSNNDLTYLPVQYVTTLAGSGKAGFADGDTTDAQFFFQYGAGLTSDGAGNLYAADAGNQRIRKITPSGKVTTIAGNGGSGAQDGPGNAATFNNPYGIAADNNGNVYIADCWNAKLRKVAADGSVTTIAAIGDLTAVAVDPASNTLYAGTFGAGIIYKVSADGNLTQVGSGFSQLSALAVDSKGNIFGVDNARSFIGVIPAGSSDMQIVAGLSGQTGLVDGAGAAAKFNRPWGLAIDKADNLFVAGNGGPSYGGGDGNDNQCVRMIKAGTWEVSTYAGGSQFGFYDGPATSALFNSPTGVAVSNNGTVYVLDESNQRIRQIISK